MDAAVWTLIALLGASTLGSIFCLGSRIDALAARIDARFDRMDAKFDALSARLDEHIRHTG